MERLPLTLANIQLHVSSVAYDKLSKVYDDAELRQLSSPEGVIKRLCGVPIHVQMDWHTDESDKIDGIFICMTDAGSIEGWKILNSDISSIYICSLTTEVIDEISHDILATKTHFAMCEKAFNKTNVTFPYTVEQFKKHDKIRDFFGRNQEMLPEALRQSLFSSSVAHNNENQGSLF